MVFKKIPVRVNPIFRNINEKFLTLDGRWKFKLDPKDEGVKKEWFNKEIIFKENIKVPGCWQGQGFGGDGNDKVWDFGLEVRVFRKTYKGTGWYMKFFDIPNEWKDKKIWLNFGGIHPTGEFYLNGKYLGKHSFPFLPFGFDITDIVSFNQENLLVIRITEEDRYLGLAYNWQGNWSGIYRSVEIRCTGKNWIEKFWIHPDVDKKRLKIYLETGIIEDEGKIVITLNSPSGRQLEGIEKEIKKDKEIRLSISISCPELWSPENPNLYRIDAVLYKGKEALDGLSERIGFLKLSTKGKHILINDQPYYFRGTGQFIGEPETGSPDTSRERWRKKLKTLKEYGYNYVRCQSFVPTPEYYDVADEIGLLIQGEMGMLGAWSGHNVWHTYAWPRPEPIYYQKLKFQWENVIIRDMNHPSANIYCMSNELYTDTYFPRIAWECYRNTKKLKPTAFVIWTDGGYNPKLPGDFVNANVETIDKETSLPVIQHEFRWWSSYPDIRIKNKYKGAIRPYAIEFAENSARKNNMEDLLPLIAENSQKLQYIEARTKLEICRRDNKTLAGICHFTATDFSFSPQGILDEFYEKKLVDADTWRQTMGDTVILIDKNFADRVIVSKENFTCSFFVSDFSHPPLKNPSLRWELFGKEKIGSGILKFKHRPFITCFAGKIEIKLPEVTKPERLILKAKLIEEERLFKNQWSFWLFPSNIKFPESVAIYKKAKYTSLKNAKFPKIEKYNLKFPEVILTEILDEYLLKYLKDGGKIILYASEGLVRPFPPKLRLTEGRYFFLPPANYPPFEDGNSGTIIISHPILGEFPHEGFADLQFYRMISESPPIDLIPLKCKKPIIRSISTYYISRPLGYLLEFSCQKGVLVITSLNLDTKLPEANYLLLQILDYLLSSRIKPLEEISEEAINFIIDVSKL